ncbi:MAG: VWA domain-containing protein [Proteobacteria bacterium]|nr:VWA domain-containing protein [Pseudomonadota bacterium]
MTSRRVARLAPFSPRRVPAGDWACQAPRRRSALGALLVLAACGENPFHGLPPAAVDGGVGDGAAASGLVVRFSGKPITESPSRVVLKLQVLTTAGEPVDGLDELDFTISEDGQPLSSSESDHRLVPAPRQFDFFTALLLDLSGSVVGHIDALQDAAQALINELPEESEAAIYSFDGRTTLQRRQDFTYSKDSLRAAVDRLGGYNVVDASTNLYGAVLQGIEVLDVRRQLMATSDESAGFLVLFTDGTDRAGLSTASQASQAVATMRRRPPGYSFFSIGLGDEIDSAELSALGPDGFATALEGEQLGGAFRAIGQRLARAAASYYTLSYCSPKRAGAHTLTIAARSRNLSGEATVPFSAKGFTGGCDALGGSAGL